MIGKLFRKITARGNASTRQDRQAEVMRDVNEALDACEITSKPLDNRETPIRNHQKRATLDRAAFFEHLRQPIFGGRISQDQVEGCEAILDAMAGDPIAWVAYALATARHETGGRFKPNTESLNYSVSGLLNTFGRHRISHADAEKLGRKPGEPALNATRQRAIANIIYGGTWGRDNLGNTEPNDGWTYRGRGLAHDTGRRNYGLSGRAVGLDLLANPDAILDLDVAVRVLTSGMKYGRYTGRSFVHFLPSIGEANAAQFGQARRIINGVDRAADIAGLALHFQGALRRAGWQ
jgi:putative chitinase